MGRFTSRLDLVFFYSRVEVGKRPRAWAWDFWGLGCFGDWILSFRVMDWGVGWLIDYLVPRVFR